MNITVKAHNLKALYPESFQPEFRKIRKLARTGSRMECIFNKIAVQYTFARIRLYRVRFLLTFYI